MKVTDPVCGMSLDLEKAIAKEDYNGWVYFFCSNNCHRLFKLSPERFSKNLGAARTNAAPSDVS